MSSNPLAYMRLVYRVPAMAAATLLCSVLAFLIGRARAYRFWAAVMSRICGRKLRITGAARDPSAQLIVANHIGYLDAIPAVRLWPDARPVVRQWFRSWFLIGNLARDSMIFVDENLPESRRRAREEMRHVWDSGGAVIVFPQGRASHGASLFGPTWPGRSTQRSGGEARPEAPGPPGVLRHFRQGSFEAAISAGVRIQGMRISYPPELFAALEGRFFEERFFWILAQNLEIQVHLFPAERAAGDAASLARSWEKRLLSSEVNTG